MKSIFKIWIQYESFVRCRVLSNAHGKYKEKTPPKMVFVDQKIYVNINKNIYIHKCC